MKERSYPESNKMYLTPKEAAARYDYSVSWFKERRRNRLPPRFVRLNGKGKILYPLVETDDWFKKSYTQDCE